MLGYCHKDECHLDIHSPDYVRSTPSHHHHILNRAFSPYAKHEQEKEDVIQMILKAARNGEDAFSIQLDDDFSDEDLEYIKEEVYRRLEN
jgi:ferritin